MKNILTFFNKTFKCSNAKIDTNTEIQLLENQHEMPHIASPADKVLLSNSEPLTKCQTNKYGANALRKLGKEKHLCRE